MQRSTRWVWRGFGGPPTLDVGMRNVLVSHTRRGTTVLGHQRTRRTNRWQIGDGGDVKQANGVGYGHVTESVDLYGLFQGSRIRLR